MRHSGVIRRIPCCCFLARVVSCDRSVSHFTTQHSPPPFRQLHVAVFVCPANTVTEFFFGGHCSPLAIDLLESRTALREISRKEQSRGEIVGAARKARLTGPKVA